MDKFGPKIMYEATFCRIYFAQFNIYYYICHLNIKNTKDMTNKDWLFLNSRDDLLRIDMREIAYFEADGNYTDIMLSNKLKCTVGMSLGKMETILSERLQGKVMYFARIGKRYVINLNMVFQINVLKHRLVLSDFRQCYYTLDVSKDALKKLKELMIQVKI